MNPIAFNFDAQHNRITVLDCHGRPRFLYRNRNKFWIKSNKFNIVQTSGSIATFKNRQYI